MTAGLHIVVVSYETCARTLRCVESALAHGNGAPVTVVDNASTDGTVSALAEEFGDRVSVLINPRNVGFGAACNQGAARVPDAEAVLFLNADTELTAGATASLLAELRSDRALGVVGPRIAGDDGEWQPSRRGDPTPHALLHQHTAWRFLRFGARAYDRYKSPPAAAPTEVLMGAALMLRGDLFRSLGGFDPRYFLYFEEADLCRRARDAGARVLLVDLALVRHAGGASSDPRRARALVWYLESLFLYVDRFHGRGHGLAYRAAFKPLFLLRMLTDATRDALTALVRPSKRASKAAELRLFVRFFARGVWRFAVA